MSRLRLRVSYFLIYAAIPYWSDGTTSNLIYQPCAVLQRERASEPVDEGGERGGEQDEGGGLVRLQLRRQERAARLRQGAPKIHSGRNNLLWERKLDLIRFELC